MKKNLLILILLVFGFANSQNKLRYGVKAGLNFSKFRGDLSNTSTRPSFVLGGLANYKINQKFAIQTEFVYTSEGTNYDSTTNIVEDFDDDDVTNDKEAIVYKENNLNLGYFAVPLMFEYYLSKVSFEFGPQINFLTYAKLHTNIKTTYEDDIIVADAYSEEVKDKINSIDFGLNFGVGYNFSKHVYGNLRYKWGMLNVTDTSEETNYNSVVTFSFGYIIN